MSIEKEHAISPGMIEKILKDGNYLQLIELMEVPEVERVIFAKLFELRRLFKEEIEKFLEKRAKNLPKAG